MDNLLSALYSYPGGYLSDRFGAKRALAVVNLVAMAGYAVVILVPSWPAVLAGAALFISWSSISAPATLSLIYTVLPGGKRTMGVSLHSLVRRLPMALGPVLGGVFIGVWGERDGVRYAFVAALALAAVALVLQQRLITDEAARGTVGAPQGNPRRLLGPDEPGAAPPAGHRHPGALLRADPLRLRGGVVPEGHRRPGVGACSSGC